MGIVNYTDDSFYDGGLLKNIKHAVKHTEKLINEGADIIDLGAMSTRPGATEIDLTTEKTKIKNLLIILKKEFPKTLISIDTYRAEVADIALSEGADIINDISGSQFDERLIDIITKHNAPYILMHTQGKPKTMQTNPKYNNIVNDVIYFLSEKINKLHLKGVNDIIIDPGFGFGKTLEHNYQLIKNLEYFKVLNKPILVAISRKSMIYKLFNQSPSESLNGTTILNTISLLKSAKIIRVHDVKEAKQIISILNMIQ
ncbi:MAG: dihydropteroate synthase [Bacteroidetes bacterium GWE2_29_8]|nr:MAG: dihydropteroate synthase [Bacteroidetes bacterium GWE2_29_8]OFY15397.1 MAG: dihydropteroate synthase [Bacteroidetes bacterium GWF2_29_10]